MKVLIIFGPPGVGKGTQAKIISKKINFEHVSTGEILREEVKKKTKEGIEIEKLISKGKFVSGRLVMKIVKKHLINSKYKGLIFDGIPRTVKQANMLLSTLKKNNVEELSVISIDAHEEELVNRLVKRSKIEGRSDDNKSTINNRMKIYHELTKPVIDFFKKNKVKVFEIDGVGSIEEVNKRIFNKINKNN